MLESGDTLHETSGCQENKVELAAPRKGFYDVWQSVSDADPGCVLQIYGAGITDASTIKGIIRLHEEINILAADQRDALSAGEAYRFGHIYTATGGWYRLHDLLIVYKKAAGATPLEKIQTVREVVTGLNSDHDVFTASDRFAYRLLGEVVSSATLNPTEPTSGRED